MYSDPYLQIRYELNSNPSHLVKTRNPRQSKFILIKIRVTLWQLNDLRLIMKSGKDLEDGLQLNSTLHLLICIILGVILMILAPIGALRQIILQAKTFEVFS
eukprot:XP_019076791.1 PREDICTED: uncharacterized protein LOC100853192 isoform X3 [Vitis vinifera]